MKRAAQVLPQPLSGFVRDIFILCITKQRVPSACPPTAGNGEREISPATEFFGVDFVSFSRIRPSVQRYGGVSQENHPVCDGSLTGNIEMFRQYIIPN
jgi:hypothetical protein